jgi:hypothetical protein
MWKKEAVFAVSDIILDDLRRTKKILLRIAGISNRSGIEQKPDSLGLS